MNRRLLVLGLLLAAAGSTLQAGGDKLEPPDLERYLRWGPVRVRPGFEISRLGYDDNILFSSGQEKVSDYTATLSPKLDGVLLLGDRAFLTFREELDYTLYVENSDQNFLNHRTSGRFTLPMSRIGFFTDLALENVEYRPVDREDIRPERRGRRIGLGVILQPGWRTEIEIVRTVSDITHVDPDPGATVAERLDRDEQATRVELAYRVLGRTRVLLDGSLKTIDFDSPFNGIPRDTRERRLLGGLELGEGGLLTGSFKLGWGTIDAQDPSLPDLAELIGEAALAYRLTSSTLVELEAERLPGFAVFEGNAYYVSTVYGLRGVHFLNRFLGVEGRVDRGKLSFPESTSGFEREDRILRYAGGVRLRLSQNSLGRRVEYRVLLGRYRRESNLESVAQSQTTFGIGAVVGF